MDRLLIYFIRSVIDFVWDSLRTFVLAFVIFFILNRYVISPHQVLGASMEPGLHNGDYVLTEKISYYFSPPSRGDIVVFKPPVNPKHEYIKRVIGLPQEEISLVDGEVFIDDQVLNEPYLKNSNSTLAHSSIKGGIKSPIPHEQFVVMGDNRMRSSDSREWGFVARENIVGKAFLRYWPPQKIGFIRSPVYPE